jgi:hypothetical protein
MNASLAKSQQTYCSLISCAYVPALGQGKRSSSGDKFHAEVFCRQFGNKSLSEIDHRMIEEFKIKRTRLADAGVDVVKIKELMGHASIVTTMRYIHATDQGKRGAIGVVRVSTAALSQDCRKRKAAEPKPRRKSLISLVHPA